MCVCVYTEGGSSVYKRLWLVFFPFFSPEGSTAALKRREGGREGQRASGMMGQGRDIGKVELTETTINPLQWCGGEMGPRLLDSLQYQGCLNVFSLF